ncbi:MAG: response regulator [bacterium]|jgi:PAS domain S-box-containing protein
MSKRKSEMPDLSGEGAGGERAPGLDPSARDVLAAILDTAGALIAVLDAQGRILIWNRTCEELTGVPAKEAVGRRLWEVANPPAEADSVREFYFELIARGFPETHERHWTAKNGERRLIKWSNTALRNADGGIEFVVATGFDITESRKAKLELEVRGHQLGERVKELACLYGISRLGERQPLDLDEFLQSVAELIPPAWQYPDLCSATISIGGKTFASGSAAERKFEMRRQIVLNGDGAGEIVVGYSENPGGGEPFLPEEHHLLDSICAAVGRVVLNHRASQRIVEYQERLRSLASELALTGERERRRIAQQLHNEIGHTMAGIKFKLSELAKEKRDARIADLIKLVEGTIDAARNITFELCPPVLHELGLGAALEWLTHQLESNYGIPCYFSDDRSAKPLGEDVRVEIFQAVREFLVNIGKHSKASRASVNVSAESGTLHICVADDGVGFDARAGLAAKDGRGWGLFGARERLSHLGADVKIESSPGKGTKITIAAPLGQDIAVGTANAASAIPANGAETAAAREPIKIMIVDDQQLTRAGFKSLLEKESDFRVVAEASDGKEAIERARELKPDVVVMDVAMPGMSGIEATRRILADEPQIRVIGLSMHADGQYVVEMLRAGATGYLLKDCAQDDLSQAIRVVHANLTFLSPGLTDRVAMKYVSGGGEERGEGEAPRRESKLSSLTKREREVLRLLAEGLNTKQVAARLKISAKTVETHRTHVMEKLGERSVAGLTRLAISEGLVTAD